MDVLEQKHDASEEESINDYDNNPTVETHIEDEEIDNMDEIEESEDVSEVPQESKQNLEPLTIPTSLESEGEAANTSTPAQEAVPTLALLVPCLKGRLFVEGTSHICRGVWAMSEELHNQPGQVGDFEFRLVKADESTAANAFPKNGKYQGWFSLKQAPPLKSTIKVDDRDMIMTFVQSEEDEYIVQGDGNNKFGSFSLRGTLKSDGTILMYRSYTTKPVVIKKEKRTLSPTSNEKVKSAKKRQSIIPEAANTPASVDMSAAGRDSMGRVRKAKSFGDEGVHASTGGPKTPRAAVPAPAPVAPKSTATKQAAIKVAKVAAPAPVAQPVNVSNRVQRVPIPMQKCSDLLKEIMKQPMSVWFGTPVDHVALNIPDYPTIITHPMDFSTVKANLDANIYSTPDDFAEHIRLIFRNAKTYNISKDNPVHIAANELSGRFEERYRSMLMHIAQNPVLSQVLNLEETVPVASSSSKKGPSKGPGAVKAAVGLLRQSSSVSVNSVKRSASIGPRVDSIVPPPDFGAQMMTQMQRQMQEMQDEIMKLRTAVRVSDVQQQIFSQREAAQNPLTYEEKKNLVSQIQQMEDDAAFQGQIVDIVRTSSTYQPRDDGEVAIDELDTLTLRKIQKFVAENFIDNSAVGSPFKKSKKNPAPGKPSAAPATVKKPKTQAPLAAAPVHASYTTSSTTEVVHASASSNVASHYAVPTQEDEDAMIESGDMLFDAGNFEVLRSEAYDGYASDQGSDMGEREEENDGDAQESVELLNAEAWTKGATTATSTHGATTSTIRESNVWKEAASEMNSAVEREAIVRQEQTRVAELKAAHDAQRLAQLQRQAIERSQQQERAEHDALREAERAAESLRRQREEERSRLSSLSQTVHMDSHAEDEEMRAFVEGTDM